MFIFKFIFAALILAILVVLGLAFSKPDSFSVERGVTIDASPERIFPLIDDFNRWPEWSPWEKLDPAMQRTLSGASSGVGAVYEWSGSREVGRGRMEITDSVPPSRITIQLDFLEPLESHNITVFTLEPQGAGTRVNWVMQGPSPFLTKIMQVFVSMDGMIGKDFETGLNNLKRLAERDSAQ